MSKSTLTPEEFRCWKVENLRQYLTMRDLAKTGKKEELAMFFGMQVRLVPPKDDVRSAKTTFLVTGISGW